MKRKTNVFIKMALYCEDCNIYVDDLKVEDNHHNSDMLSLRCPHCNYLIDIVEKDKVIIIHDHVKEAQT